MLDHVINAVVKSATFINRGKGDIKVSTCLLTPEGDPLADAYRGKIKTYEGAENDVLSRYAVAFDSERPDYLVRITSDTPMLPPFIITKHIITACKHGFDYTSNVDPVVRTSPDGHDTEVISSRLFNWLLKNATEKGDREHVTTLARSNPPEWCRTAHLVCYADYSQLKLSVDTEGDLEFVRGMYDLLNKKIKKAKESGDGFFRL